MTDAQRRELARKLMALGPEKTAEVLTAALAELVTRVPARADFGESALQQKAREVSYILYQRLCGGKS